MPLPKTARQDVIFWSEPLCCAGALAAECPVPSAGSGSLQTTAEEDIYMKPGHEFY